MGAGILALPIGKLSAHISKVWALNIGIVMIPEHIPKLVENRSSDGSLVLITGSACCIQGRTHNIIRPISYSLGPQFVDSIDVFLCLGRMGKQLSCGGVLSGLSKNSK